jgi:hypothetical protein
MQRHGRGPFKGRPCQVCRRGIDIFKPTFRCMDCYGSRLLCKECMLSEHKHLPLHFIEASPHLILHGLKFCLHNHPGVGRYPFQTSITSRTGSVGPARTPTGGQLPGPSQRTSKLCCRTYKRFAPRHGILLQLYQQGHPTPSATRVRLVAFHC